MERATPVTLRALYDEHARHVIRNLRYLGVREADLDDATQETFVVAHRKLGDVRPDTSYRAWLCGIALNVARHMRRGRSTLSIDDTTPMADGTDMSARVEARSELMAMLGDLDQQAREVVVLYHIEDLSLREVAEALGCPLQTVYSRLQAGTRQMKAARERRERSVR